MSNATFYYFLSLILKHARRKAPKHYMCWFPKTQKAAICPIQAGAERMVKKVIIEISLVEESLEKASDEIASEIFSEISEGRAVIPWCKQVDKVAVTGA
jgi:hypothetical protein